MNNHDQVVREEMTRFGQGLLHAFFIATLKTY